MKVCSRCKKLLPRSSFYKCKAQTSGLTCACKVCERNGRDKEKRRQYEKEYWSKRKPEKAAIVKKSMANNKDHHYQVLINYRNTDSFRVSHRTHGATRRTRMANAFVEHVDYGEIYAESGGSCFYCGAPVAFKEAEFDHYIPIAKGGLHKKENIKCSCRSCNRSKGAKLPEGADIAVV